MEVRKRRKVGADEYEEDDEDVEGSETLPPVRDAAAQAKDTKAG